MDTMVWSMKVTETAKIIAARIRFRDRPPVALLTVMAPLKGLSWRASRRQEAGARAQRRAKIMSGAMAAQTCAQAARGPSAAPAIPYTYTKTDHAAPVSHAPGAAVPGCRRYAAAQIASRLPRQQYQHGQHATRRASASFRVPVFTLGYLRKCVWIRRSAARCRACPARRHAPGWPAAR